MIRTVICDDHPVITQGLTSYLFEHEQIEVIGAAASAQNLRELLPVAETDVLLLEIQLTDGSGIEVCGEVKRNYTYIQILGLSNLDDRNGILRKLNEGASGYVLKSAPMEEIVKAILNIYDGGVYLGEHAQKSFASSKPDVSEEIPPVTRREKEVLRYLAQGLSSTEIAEKKFVSPLTVDTHRRNLLQKFNVNKTVNLLQKAKDVGLIDG